MGCGGLHAPPAMPPPASAAAAAAPLPPGFGAAVGSLGGAGSCGGGSCCGGRGGVSSGLGMHALGPQLTSGLAPSQGGGLARDVMGGSVMSGLAG